MLIEHDFSLMNSLTVFGDQHAVPRGPAEAVFGDCPRMRTLPESLFRILPSACLPNTFLRKHTMPWSFLEWICSDHIVPTCALMPPPLTMAETQLDRFFFFLSYFFFFWLFQGPRQSVNNVSVVRIQ